MVKAIQSITITDINLEDFPSFPLYHEDPVPLCIWDILVCSIDSWYESI